MSKEIRQYCVVAICSIALISTILFLLGDNATISTLTVLAFFGITTTVCIWFLVAWHIYELKLRDIIKATLLCISPYLITLLLNYYMAPYEGSNGGNASLIIFGDYANILFNTNYHLLRSIVTGHIESVLPIILLLQILIPFLLAFSVRGFNQILGIIGSRRKNSIG